MNDVLKAYDDGYRDGYVAGESERQALAIANSELRHDLREALVKLNPRLRWTFDDIGYKVDL